MLTTQPIRTKLNATHYEWAGSALRRLFRSRKPIAEVWAFFSGPQRPARVDAPGTRRLTLYDVVRKYPEILGPSGADPRNQGQKYFFVKFLDPSDFPPFAYVGFRPEAVRKLRMSARAVRTHMAGLLWQDRAAVERLAALMAPRIRSRNAFEAFKAAYKRWAIAQARDNWSADADIELNGLVPPSSVREARACLDDQRRIRQRIVGLMHRIDYEDGQAILIETPTLHAIAGLSLQLHPKTRANFHPKDELWIYAPLRLPDGARGWVLVEPQRTFDKTESGADFFTPYAWQEERRTLGFRKAITPAYLKTFVSLMDAAPRPRAHYVRTAARLQIPGGRIEGRAQWYRVVEEKAWPYFTVRQLRFDGAGAATVPLPHHSFTELHVTEGAVEATFARGTASLSCAVRPDHPALLPATLPYDTVAYRSRGPARLYVFTRPRSRHGA